MAIFRLLEYVTMFHAVGYDYYTNWIYYIFVSSMLLPEINRIAKLPFG